MSLTEQSQKTPSVGSSKTDSTGSINIAIECAVNGNIERFMRCFDDEADPFHDSVIPFISTRSEEDNKSALDWAALMGNVAMVSELIRRGADVNAVSEKGKLHHFFFSYAFHEPRTASSSAECSRDKPPFSFVRGQDSTM